MPNVDRMYQVIVLGGIALATVPASWSVAGCGGAVEGPLAKDMGDAGAANDAGSSDAFPHEGRAVADAGADTFVAFDSGFPQETAQIIDSGPFDTGVDAFPQEGPAMIDSGFPQETAQIIDSGSTDTGVDAFPQEGPPPLDAGGHANG
jgi:hypothetical protein